MSAWREDLACAAGFFNGEGNISLMAQAGRPLGAKITIGQVDRWVLDQFKTSIGGLGAVRGPYTANRRDGCKRQPLFMYQCGSFEHVQAVVAMLWHWLSPVKREQAKRVLVATHDRRGARRRWRQPRLGVPQPCPRAVMGNQAEMVRADQLCS